MACIKLNRAQYKHKLGRVLIKPSFLSFYSVLFLKYIIRMRKSLFTGPTWSCLSDMIFIPYFPHPPSTFSFFNFFSGFLPTAVTWLALTLMAKVVNK